MKHEITSMNTKKMFAASLKGFMEKKPLSKITVSEIVNDCGVNRKTFYYHFEDIYALLKWMLEQEALEVIKQFDLLVDCREVVLFVMNYVRQNKHLLCCAYDNMGRDELRHFFCIDFMGILRNMIDSTEKQLKLHIDEDFKTFLSHLYAEAISGLLVSEFTSNEDHDPEKAVEFFSLVIQSSIPSALINAPTCTGNKVFDIHTK